MNFSFFFGSFLIGFVSLFLSMLMFILQRMHYMMTLLSLEFMILGLFLMLLSITYLGFESFLVFVLLSFAACEAALGLGLLVSVIRSHGSDFLSVMTVFEC